MIEYSNDGIIGGGFGQCRGSVIPLGLLVALPSACFSVLLMILNVNVVEFMDTTGTDSIKASQLYAAMSATLIFLIGFRTNKAYGRFWDGTTLLHQMFGEWFDAASCLIAFSSLARTKQPHDVWNFRHTLIRLMSLMHSSALDEIAQTAGSNEGYPALDIGGLDQGTLRYLRDCKFDMELDFNRVEVILHMIQTLVVKNQSNGVLLIPPPILSRVFQTLSRGQVNLANCKKITHTLFPFPYAQMIGYLVVVFSIVTPVIMASVCKHEHWAFILTIIPVFGVFALNNIARQLEAPFGDDDNDLPLNSFQEHMNNSLLMLIRGEADHVPFISEKCNLDYTGTKDTLKTTARCRPKEFLEDPDKQKSEITCCDDYASYKSSQALVAPAPTPAPQQPPVSAPAQPAAPAVGASAAKPSGMELALQKVIEDLGTSFKELMESTRSLSVQLSQNTDIMTQFVSHGMMHTKRSTWRNEVDRSPSVPANGVKLGLSPGGGKQLAPELQEAVAIKLLPDESPGGAWNQRQANWSTEEQKGRDYGIA